MADPSRSGSKATVDPGEVPADDDLCTEDLRLFAEADEDQRGVAEEMRRQRSERQGADSAKRCQQALEEHCISINEVEEEGQHLANELDNTVLSWDGLAQCWSRPQSFRSNKSSNTCPSSEGGQDHFAAAIAKSFANAEKALSDSHEAALRFIAHCIDENRQGESPLPRPFRPPAPVPFATLSTSPVPAPSGSRRSLMPPCMAGPPAKGLPPARSPRPKVTWSSATEDAPPKPQRPSQDPVEPTTPVGNPQSLPGALPAMEVKVEMVGEPRGRSPAGVQQARHPSRIASHTSIKSVEVRRPSKGSTSSGKSGAVKQELLETWSKPPSPNRKRPYKKLGKITRSCTNDSLLSMDQGVASRPFCPWGPTIPVIDPNSTVRASWDIVSIFLVIYDMVMIPLQLFDIPETFIIILCSWMTRLFWSLDVFVSFFTGILKRDGSIEVRPSRIARQYLRTWFVVDIFIVGVDWIEVLWSNGSFLGFARAGKASRTFRIIRLVRLIRLARLRTVFRGFMERLKSEQLVVIAGIISIMLVIVSMSHIMGCVWYGIAVTAERPDTWLKQHGFEDKDIAMKYFTALHWSLLQFSGGSDEIVPQNTGERIYAVIVFLIAFVMAAVFVGRLTSSMTQLHMLSRKDLEKFQVLKRYLQKNEISAVLSMRVMHNAQHALMETQRFMEESRVELLGIISEPLRVELHFELYSPVLAVHPFFRVFIDACPQVMKKVCHKAVSQLLVSTGDVLFMPGEVPCPPRMLIICSGNLSYHFVNGAVAYIQAGQWLSEAVLWSQWTHQGMLKAASDCRLVVLDAHVFLQLAETFDHDFDVRRYARTFVECMNDGTIECSDLPFQEDSEKITEVISQMQTIREVQTVAEPQAKLLRRASSLSITSGSGSALGEDSPRKSVLMVTPGGGSTKTWW